MNFVYDGPNSYIHALWISYIYILHYGTAVMSYKTNWLDIVWTFLTRTHDLLGGLFAQGSINFLLSWSVITSRFFSLVALGHSSFGCRPILDSHVCVEKTAGLIRKQLCINLKHVTTCRLKDHKTVVIILRKCIMIVVTFHNFDEIVQTKNSYCNWQISFKFILSKLKRNLK